MSDVACQVGSGHLRAICDPVDIDSLDSSDLRAIISDMKDVNKSMSGVGISANQIGHRLRISVIAISPTKYRPDITAVPEYVMINPVVTESRGSTSIAEGCLSVAEAGLFADVVRPESIMVTYFDEKGVQQSKHLNGFEARVVQHELDHLDGKVFLDHDYDPSTLRSRSEHIRVSEERLANT